MQIGWSDADVQVARFERQRLLAECERQRVITGLLPTPDGRPGPALRRRVGDLLVQARQRLQGVEIATWQRFGAVSAGTRGTRA